MNLDDISAGSLCVVDTNVLVYAEQGVPPQAQHLIRRCASDEMKGVLPQTVWQELTHNQMLADAKWSARKIALKIALYSFSLYSAAR